MLYLLIPVDELRKRNVLALAGGVVRCVIFVLCGISLGGIVQLPSYVVESVC